MTSNKFYFDTEFIEGFRKPIWWLPTIGSFNRKRWFIELISIGIVSDGGRTYYAVSNEFNPRHAGQWVKDNVIAKLPLRCSYVSNDWATGMEPMPLAIRVENPIYKSNKQIAQEIYQFVVEGHIKLNGFIGFDDAEVINYLKAHPPTFIAYFADYDWVLLCTLFGSMMNLPKGFPKYCYDMKQEVDRIVWNKIGEVTGNYPDIHLLHMQRDSMFKNVLQKEIKDHPDYPKQTAEHDALDDALFVRNLHNFIIKYQQDVKV